MKTRKPPLQVAKKKVAPHASKVGSTPPIATPSAQSESISPIEEKPRSISVSSTQTVAPSPTQEVVVASPQATNGVLAQPLDAADNDVVALESASDASVDDLLLIDREYMSVVEVVSANNLKVLRAQAGSKIAPHDIGAPVRIGVESPEKLGIALALASPATESVSQFGRIAVFANLSGVMATIVANSSVYATAAGGLPIDLAPILTIAAPFSQPYLNPADVVGVLPAGLSANGYTAGALKLGTPVYAPATYPFTGGGSALRPAQQLTSAPAWIRLAKGGTEMTDGANTDTITVLLLIARGGTNDN